MTHLAYLTRDMWSHVSPEFPHDTIELDPEPRHLAFGITCGMPNSSHVHMWLHVTQT